MAVAVVTGLVGGAAEGQQGNTINVVVGGIRDNTGSIRCGLFNSPSTFPKDGQEYKGAVAPIANGQATCTFADVPPGTYAVAYFKARPGQTKMETGLFGMPQDPYGFSRNATIGMGPPPFNSAAYAYPGGPTTWPVTITYP
ncbi:DUF2141 domain-containing protein [Reyranella sp.]|uniref:DUF2141 domain-containing protein n=1 Tax=Reyranella sp. TaxID=1929291 RepID=UPI003BA898BE